MNFSKLLATPLLLHAVAASSLGAQRVVPIHEEPRHRVVYQGSAFRVLDVQIPPGDTSLYHLHATPILYTSIAASPTKEQLVGEEWPASGAAPLVQRDVGQTWSDTIYTIRPKSHRVTNTGDRLFRLIAVVTSEPIPRRFTTQVGVELFGTQELSSSWMRQTRVTLASGESTPWKTATRAVVVILPMAASVTLERDGGTSSTLSEGGAFAVVAAGDRYRLRNPWGQATNLVSIQPH